MPNDAFNLDDMWGDGLGKARLLMFLGFATAFGSVFGAGWIMGFDYLRVPLTPPEGVPQSMVIYPGIACFIQNLLIFGR